MDTLPKQPTMNTLISHGLSNQSMFIGVKQNLGIRLTFLSIFLSSHKSMTTIKSKYLTTRTAQVNPTKLSKIAPEKISTDCKKVNRLLVQSRSSQIQGWLSTTRIGMKAINKRSSLMMRNNALMTLSVFPKAL